MLPVVLHSTAAEVGHADPPHPRALQGGQLQLQLSTHLGQREHLGAQGGQSDHGPTTVCRASSSQQGLLMSLSGAAAGPCPPPHAAQLPTKACSVSVPPPSARTCSQYTWAVRTPGPLISMSAFSVPPTDTVPASVSPPLTRGTGTPPRALSLPLSLQPLTHQLHIQLSVSPSHCHLCSWPEPRSPRPRDCWGTLPLPAQHLELLL